MNGPRRTPRHVGVKLVLLAMCCYFLIPVWWLLVASTKNAEGLFAGTGALWFRGGFHLFDNLHDLFTFNNGEFLRWLGNSVLYASAGGIGCTVISVLAGYGFAKYNFRGRNIVFALLLGSVMVPLTALVIPTFVMMSNAGLTDTIWAVILPSASTAPRCHTARKASMPACTTSRRARPSRAATTPTPQASCSLQGS